jgi:ribonuclease HI
MSKDIRDYFNILSSASPNQPEPKSKKPKPHVFWTGGTNTLNTTNNTLNTTNNTLNTTNNTLNNATNNATNTTNNTLNTTNNTLNTTNNTLNATNNTLNTTNAKEELITFECFTDGSAIGNGSSMALAGIGVYFPSSGIENVSFNYYDFVRANPELKGEKGTNNITELLAILISIKLINKKFASISNASKCLRIIIYSDSEYSINCITKWAAGWERNGWKKKGGPIKNLSIIKQLYQYYKSQRIKFIHINSHCSEPKNKNSVEWKLWFGNDMADRLARAGTLKS